MASSNTSKNIANKWKTKWLLWRIVGKVQKQELELHMTVEMKNRLQNTWGSNGKIPYMLVVGDKEKEENKVTVRSRSKADLGTISIDEFIEKVLGEIKDKKV